jgi:hypothetical protein
MSSLEELHKKTYTDWHLGKISRWELIFDMRFDGFVRFSFCICFCLVIFSYYFLKIRWKLDGRIAEDKTRSSNLFFTQGIAASYMYGKVERRRWQRSPYMSGLDIFQVHLLISITSHSLSIHWYNRIRNLNSRK